MALLQIPPRIERIPEWLFQPAQDNDEDQVTQDLLAITFWKNVDTDIAKEIANQKVKLNGGTDPVAIRNRIEGSLQDPYVLTRRMATVCNEVYDTETGLQTTIERAKIRLLSFMRQNNLFKHLENADVEEFLLSKVSPDAAESIMFDIGFMVNWLLPVLEANGIPQDLIVGIKDNYSKARALVPPLRRVLNTVVAKAGAIQEKLKQETDPKQKKILEEQFQEAIIVETGPKEMLEEFIRSLTDIDPATGKKFAVLPFQKRIVQIERGIQDEHPIEPAVAQVIILPNGESIIYIKTTSQVQHRLIEMTLGKTVDLHHGTAFELIEEVTKIILPIK